MIFDILKKIKNIFKSIFYNGMIAAYYGQMTNSQVD